MDIEDIYNLPVQNITADDAVLFLWVTNPLLQEGLETIKRWSFQYKTVAFSWYKKNKIADTFFMSLG
jgi:N6-adenosine-specific RNA methylase IME4